MKNVRRADEFAEWNGRYAQTNYRRMLRITESSPLKSGCNLNWELHPRPKPTPAYGKHCVETVNFRQLRNSFFIDEIFVFTILELKRNRGNWHWPHCCLFLFDSVVHFFKQMPGRCSFPARLIRCFMEHFALLICAKLLQLFIRLRSNVLFVYYTLWFHLLYNPMRCITVMQRVRIVARCQTHTHRTNSIRKYFN